MTKKRKDGAAPAQQNLQREDEPEAHDLDLSSDEEGPGDAVRGGAGSKGKEAAEPPSSSDGDGDSDIEASRRDAAERAGSLDSDEEEFREAVADYYAEAAQRSRRQHKASKRDAENEGDDGGNDQPADGQPEQQPRPPDPGSDSSEDEERPNRNTVGDVPLVWYKDEEHIGYDLDGKQLLKSKRGDKLDQLLARNDSRRALRTVYDEYNDEEIVLSKEELEMVMRIRRGQFPHVEVDPYEPYVDWFSGEREKQPLTAAPEPKRRFIPSKWEEKKIVKLVRAIRKGWLKKPGAGRKSAAPPVYLLWGDDDTSGDPTAKSGSGLTYIPAAKPLLPGHEESYNPPKEYLPTEEELAGYQLLDEEDRPKFIPTASDSLRQVPAYSQFIVERFERCLDLYLAPRVRKKRMHIDPESLVPKLPSPSDLRPFPHVLALRYTGHVGRVRCLSPHPGGQWLASGGDDGSLRVWEVETGRCLRSWDLGAPVMSVAWCPNLALQLLAAAVAKCVVLLPSGLGGEAAATAAAAALAAAAGAGGGGGAGGALAPDQLTAWVPRPGDGGVDIVTRHPVRQVTWHGRGDYFASVAPGGATQAVLVHQLSKLTSQNPFRKNRGRISRVAFHPTKPFFFVATQNHVRVYNLAKQALAKKLLGGSGVITCLAVHASGDHVIVGSEDKRLAWYDLDLSTTPYKALRYHTTGVRGAAFHPTYPLFASCADDGAAHVFHGRVYADLMTNPLIVPVKILRGHQVVDHSGVLDCAFHPQQPWLFTAGADATICLFCN